MEMKWIQQRITRFANWWLDRENSYMTIGFGELSASGVFIPHMIKRVHVVVKDGIILNEIGDIFPAQGSMIITHWAYKNGDGQFVPLTEKYKLYLMAGDSINLGRGKLEIKVM